MARLNAEGKLGSVILDLGSGTSHRARYSVPLNPDYYPISGKKIIRADILAPSKFNVFSGPAGETIATLRHDIQKPPTKPILARLSKFLGINPANCSAPIDTVLMSDILNYIDYKKTILNVSRYLKKGGRLIINHSDVGIVDLFHDKRPKTNQELADFLESNGFKIEHLTSSSYTDSQYMEVNAIKEMHPNEQIVLVARKIR